MTSNSQNSEFQTLLKGYMAPAKDDGFTQSVLAQIEAQNQQREQRITTYRRVGLYSAAFMGGIVAAVQLPKLSQLFKSLNTNTPSLPDVEISSLGILTANLSQSTALIGGTIIILFALWVIIDQRSAEFL